jgi:hypothetical protein
MVVITHCPFCHHEVTATVRVQGPHKGDVNMCVGCGEVSIYDGGLRRPSPDELVMIAEATNIAELTMQWRDAHEVRLQ